MKALSPAGCPQSMSGTGCQGLVLQPPGAVCFGRSPRASRGHYGQLLGGGRAGIEHLCPVARDPHFHGESQWERGPLGPGFPAERGSQAGSHSPGSDTMRLRNLGAKRTKRG